jgi:tetratricopeptide (TPR) repeat protein
VLLIRCVGIDFGGVLPLMMEYDWFRVRMWRSEDGKFKVEATSFLGDSGVLADFTPPFDETQAKDLLSGIESGKVVGHENLKRIGELFYKSVFSDGIKEYFERCLGLARRSDRGLRVELVVDPLYLKRLPWELMHDSKDFLALSSVTPVVRTVLQAEPPVSHKVSFPLGILFAAASPVGSGVPINVGGEIRRLCDGVSKSVMDGRVRLRCYGAGKIRSQEFQDDIRSERFHVLHVSSHGVFAEGMEKGFLELEDEQGRSIPVGVETLGAWIKDSSIQMVYLDACQTAVGSVRTPLADLGYVFLNKGVNAVLAMQFSVPVETANSLCEAFYSRLSRREPIELALSEARKQTVDSVYGLDRIDWAIPVLYVSGRDVLHVGGEPEPKRAYKPLPSLGIFVGRQNKLNQLTEDLIDPEVSLISVDGFGGIGKSSFVLKFANDVRYLFADACWIDCRPKISYDRIVEEINEMLVSHEIGLAQGELVRHSSEGRTVLIADALEKKDDGFLVIFDNFDSVEDDANIRNLIQKISEGKRTKVIVTMRLPIGLVRGQRFFRLERLEENDAILLMRRLARQHSIDAVEGADELVLKRVNARVDGHPGAVEVVIPWLKTEPLEIVLEQLPQVLAGNIGPILEWSFKKLTEEEKGFLLEISVFEGEVPVDALMAVHTLDYAAPVKEVVEKNLLSYDGSRGLYDLHPLVREFAYNQLRRERKRKLHRQAARYFLSDRVKDPVSAIYHLYKAEDWKSGISLTSKILETLVLRGLWAEATNLCEQGLIASKEIEDEQTRLIFSYELGSMHYRFGNYDEAEKLCKESLKIAQELGDKRGISTSLHQLAMIEQDRGNYDEAEKLHKESLRTLRELGDKSGISASLHQLAMIEQVRGNYDEAEKLHKESLRTLRELGHKNGIALSFGQLGRLSETRNQLHLAKQYYEKALQIFNKIGDKPHATLAQKDLDRIKTKIEKQKQEQ